MLESIFLVCYYVVYVITVVVGRYLYQTKKRKRFLQFQEDQERRRLLKEEGGENDLIEQAGRQLMEEQPDTTTITDASGFTANPAGLFQSDLSAENQYGPWFFKYKTFASKAHGTRTRSVLQESVPVTLNGEQRIRATTDTMLFSDSIWRSLRQTRAGTSSMHSPIDEEIPMNSGSFSTKAPNSDDIAPLEIRIPAQSTEDETAPTEHWDSFASNAVTPKTQHAAAGKSSIRPSPQAPSILTEIRQEPATRLPLLPKPPQVPRLLVSIPHIDLIYPEILVVWDTFFPFFGNAYARSWPETIGGVLSIPAIFLLTLTIPVVDLDKDNDVDKLREIEREILLARYGQANSPTGDEDVATTNVGDPPLAGMARDTTRPSEFFLDSIDQHILSLYPPWQKWLLMVHCITSPLFVVIGVGYSSTLSLVLTSVFGAGLSTAVFFTTSQTKRPFFYKVMETVLSGTDTDSTSVLLGSPRP